MALKTGVLFISHSSLRPYWRGSEQSHSVLIARPGRETVRQSTRATPPDAGKGQTLIFEGLLLFSFDRVDWLIPE